MSTSTDPVELFPELMDTSGLPEATVEAVTEWLGLPDPPSFPSFEEPLSLPPVVQPKNPTAMELHFWSAIALLGAFFSRFDTCIINLIATKLGLIFSVGLTSSKIQITPAVDNTGIMIHIDQIYDGVVCSSIFIVNFTNELLVLSVNGMQLPERIVCATAIGTDVIFSDIVHPMVTKIYNSHSDMFRLLLI